MELLSKTAFLFKHDLSEFEDKILGGGGFLISGDWFETDFDSHDISIEFRNCTENFKLSSDGLKYIWDNGFYCIWIFYTNGKREYINLYKLYATT